MNNKRHIDLNVHSRFSKQESVVSPAEIVEFAVKDGAKAVAITDLNTVESFSEFSKAVQKYDGDFKAIYGVRVDCLDTKHKGEPFQITLLAKNQGGLRNMYKIISSGYLKVISEAQWPCVDWSYVLDNREGLLIGKECKWEYIYCAQDMDDLNKAITEINSKLAGADYIECRPWSQNPFKTDLGWDVDEAKLKKTARAVMDSFRAGGKLPVAVSNANCITAGDKVCWEMLHFDISGFRDATPCFLESTENILADYSFLGKSMSEELVLNNPSLIVASIEQINPINEGFFPIILPNAEKEVRDTCNKSIRKKYGDTIPDIIKNRLEDELKKISYADTWSYYLLASKLAAKCDELGFFHTSRGCMGSSFVAYLMGATETNPLPPHYYCPNCKSVEFVEENKYQSGFDLVRCGVERKRCSVCGSELAGDGHNIPCEFFTGMVGDIIPYIDFNVPEEAKETLLSFLEALFGKDKTVLAGTSKRLNRNAGFIVKRYLKGNGATLSQERKEYYANRIGETCYGNGIHPGYVMIVQENDDIYNHTPAIHANRAQAEQSRKPITQIPYFALELGGIHISKHPMLSELKLMEEYSGVPAKGIQFEDIDILSFFMNDSYQGLPFYNEEFVHEVVNAVSPVKFSDLLKISGFVHGTNTWTDNAERLVGQKCAIEDTIAFRDDVMMTLLQHGLCREDAFEIAEIVRKGRACSRGWDGKQLTLLMKEHNIPDWYIESMKKIRYLFPKAHAAEYVINYLRMIWYKINYPVEFYASVLTYETEAFFNCQILTEGKISIERELERFEEGRGRAYRNSERNGDTWAESKKKTLELALECCEKGIAFLPADINASDETRFVPENGSIRIPFNHPD